MFTSPASHYLPQWYPLLAEFTPPTVVLARGDDYASALRGLPWPGYFVKDFVKSLTTSRGSFADSPEEVADVVSLIERYRGFIEGGVCVRCREDLVQGSERRFFVLNGEPFGADEDVPPEVRESSLRVKSPFFSIDVAERRDGVLRIVELGDGQVSDRKNWQVNRFVHMLTQAE